MNRSSYYGLCSEQLFIVEWWWYWMVCLWWCISQEYCTL